MSKHSILESALEERYEYLEELKGMRDFLDLKIKVVQEDVDQLVLKTLQATQK